MALSSSLPSSLSRNLQDLAQVGQVEQGQAVVVGVAEDERERRRLRLVGVHHLGQQLRAERRDRGPHRHARAEAAEGEEGDGEPVGAPLDAELAGPAW